MLGDATPRSQDVIDDLTKCRSAEEAVRRFQRYTTDNDFLGFTYLSLEEDATPGGAPYFHTTSPMAFIEDYLAADCLTVDPMVDQVRLRWLPFSWAAVYETADKRRYQRGMDLVNQVAQDHGYRDGLVVPCTQMTPSGPRNVALVTFYWTDPPEQMARRLVLSQDTLHLAAHYLHITLERLRRTALPRVDLHSFTLREIECLRWVSMGKTSGEIATILGVKNTTVDFHLNNAMQKLGVYTRPHAVALAVRVGLV